MVKYKNYIKTINLKNQQKIFLQETMFKKPVKVSAQNQLSGKDKKVIKSKLSDCLDNDCIQKIFTINDKIISCKIAGAKMLIFNGQQYPLFVDGTGKHNYFPSLYVASAYQPLIKTLVINQGVQTYIYNGANLMWPGVRDFEGLGNFTKDQTIGIRNSKGQIIAIGAMGCSKKDLTDTSGVAVYILHYLGDKLWEMGTKNYPEVIIPLKVQITKQQNKIQQKQEQTQKQQVQQQKTEDKAVQKKEKKVEQKKNDLDQKKPKSPEQKKKKQKSQSEQSQDDDNFMSLVHDKNQPKGRVIKMQPKANLKTAFIEDQNQEKNTKNKKKPQPTQQKGGKQKGGKQKKQESQQDQDVMEQQQQTQNKKQKDKKGGKKKGKQQKKPKKKQQSEEDDEQKQPEVNKPSKKQEKKQARKDDGSQDEEEEKNDQKSVINSKLMDEYFKESMLNAIKLTKIQAELPIDSGKFYMDYMLLARPQGVKLEIKQSTYKKIGKFFEQMAKKKIIQYKHPKDKKAQGATINKIFWENEELKSFIPTIKKLASKQEQQKVETYSKAKLKFSKTVNLQTVYKPSKQLFEEVLKKPLNLMPAEGQKQVTDQQQIQFVTEKQLREKIERYINKIADGNKQKKQQGPKKVQKTVLIDYNKREFLRNLLIKQIEQHEQNKEKDELLKAQQNSDEQGDKKKKKHKKGGAGKQTLKVDRNYLAEKLMKKASPHYHLYDKQNGLDLFKQGTFKGVQLTAQKANNKNVTRIQGLEFFITPKQQADDQIHGLGNTFQTKFACSVNIQNLPGKNAGKEIIVHGAFLDELQQIFTTEYQLPSKFITTLNKLQKKKKN